MDFQVFFKVNPAIYKKDPETSETGKKIISSSISMICKIGFEQFTFKKLAMDMHTTEATIYRYFESKHRILLYILNWYWSYLEFLVIFRLQNIDSSREKLKIIIDLVTGELPATAGKDGYNLKFLNQIVIAESSKVYLTREVTAINKNEVFKPYKDLCATIAGVIQEYNPSYKYPRSLSTTIIEAAHQQQYFSVYLPRLTDAGEKKEAGFTHDFIRDLVYKILDKK